MDDFRTIFHLPQANDNNHASFVPPPSFSDMIIISHYMTIFPEISRRARDAYHNLQDDDIMKNIFNSEINKNKVFGLDVPLTQSQPTESTQHLAAEEIEKLVENPENVDDSSPPRYDDTSIPGTRLEPRSDKESPEVEIVQEKEKETTKDMEVEPDKDTPMVDVTNIVIPVNVNDEEDEITDEVFELRR
ncbi:hypothetical protein Tco_0062778, partial [Tanacetum coccineum]